MASSRAKILSNDEPADAEEEEEKVGFFSFDTPSDGKADAGAEAEADELHCCVAVVEEAIRILSLELFFSLCFFLLAAVAASLVH